MHIVDLYYIQKEIKALVKSNYKLKIDVQTQKTQELSRNKAEMDSEQQKIAVQSKEHLRDAWNDHTLKVMDMVRILLDIPLTLYHMSIDNKLLSGEAIAMCGVVSSAISIYRIYDSK